MLIRVRDGAYDPQGELNCEEALEPTGKELWSGHVDDLTAASLHAAAIHADPGTWYEMDLFKGLVLAAEKTVAAPAGEIVFSAVSTPQPGVHKPWIATIEVAERNAALMVCRSIIAHIDQLSASGKIWIRVE